MSKTVRTCLGCGYKKDKLELCRFVVDNEGVLVPDKNHRMKGRGAYTCRSSGCLKRFLQNTKRLQRAFRRHNLAVGKDLVGIFRSK